MGYRKDLRHRTIAVLGAAQLFRQDCLKDSETLPTEQEDLPAASVWTLASTETGQSPFMTVLDFPTTITLTIELGMDGISAGQLAADLDDKAGDVVETLLCDNDWLSHLEGIESIVTSIKPNSEGDKRLITAEIEIACVVRPVYQPRVDDDLKTVGIKVDVIDPIADPNLKYPGPDGRIEFVVQIDDLSD